MSSAFNDPTAAPNPALPGPVLVIDDDPFVRTVIVAALADLPGVGVKACASGAEALGVAVALRPALVLLDFVMPEMDGRATWRALRKCLAGLPGMPPRAVFLTARDDFGDGASDPGVAGVLAKPFNPATLVDDLRRLLAGEPGSRVAREGRLAAVGADFRRSLPATVDVVNQLLNELRTAPWSAEPAEALLTKVHTVAGSAGLFGYADVGETAAVVERILITLARLGRPPDGTERGALELAIAAFTAACRAT